MADVAFTTRIQLRTTYDLSVIYRAPLSLNDVEDCYWVFLTALGIKAYELSGNVLKVVGPKVLQYNARKLLRAGVRRFLIEVVQKVAGSQIARKLTEKALLRVAVPGIGIPVSAGMRLDGHRIAEIVPVLEEIRHGLRHAVDPHGDTPILMELHAFEERRSRETDDVQGWLLADRTARLLADSEPDLRWFLG